MRVVFVVEYDVPGNQDDIRRKINEVRAALRLPSDDAERRSAIVCIEETADRVIACLAAAPRRRMAVAPFVHDGQGPDIDPATGDEAETFQPEVVPGVAASTFGVQRGRRLSGPLLEEVAAIYRAAYADRRPVTKAVAQQMGCSTSTAGKRIMAARKAGLLEGVVPGVVTVSSVSAGKVEPATPGADCVPYGIPRPPLTDERADELEAFAAIDHVHGDRP